MQITSLISKVAKPLIPKPLDAATFYLDLIRPGQVGHYVKLAARGNLALLGEVLEESWEMARQGHATLRHMERQGNAQRNAAATLTPILQRHTLFFGMPSFTGEDDVADQYENPRFPRPDEPAKRTCEVRCLRRGDEFAYDGRIYVAADGAMLIDKKSAIIAVTCAESDTPDLLTLPRDGAVELLED